MFPYFEIFGKTVGSYAVCAVIGVLVCGAVGTWLGARYRVPFEDVVLYMLAIVLGLLAGGHILYGITHIKELASLLGSLGSYEWKETLMGLGMIFGGMVYYGGFLGAAVGLLIYTRFNKSHPRWVVFDLYAVTIPLFHTFGRIGCFFGGCCYGREGSWGFVVHGNTVVPEINDVRRLPVPLIESACNFCIFLILLYVFRKETQQGKLVFWYMIIYAPVRFVLEFFRGDEIRGFLWGLSTSQWISILLFLTGILVLARQKTALRGV